MPDGPDPALVVRKLAKPRAICQGVKVLEQQPGVGRPVEDMDDEFRDWMIEFGDTGDVARYRLDPQFVTVLAVRHQKEV